MTNGAKTALAIKAMLGFVQPHLSGRAIGMYRTTITMGQRRSLKIPMVLSAANA